MGVKGAAIATLITYLTMFLMVFFYSQKIYKIELDYLRITIIFLGAVGIFVIGYFVVNRTELSLGFKATIDIGMVILYLMLLNITGMFRLNRIAELFKKS